MDQRTVNDLADELSRALVELDVPGSVAPGGVRPDGFGELDVSIDGRHLVVAVTTRAELRPAAARELRVFGADAGPEPDLALVFADRLSERSREVLREQGWGWLDRKRGNLRLWCPGLRLDAAVTPSAAVDEIVRVRDPFTPAGRVLAHWLLLHPGEAASPRGIARELDVSAGQVSNLLRALSADSLLRRDKTPLLPELFWALVERWKPKRHALASMPAMNELVAAPELQSHRWVMGDTRAAAAYGVPLAAGTGYPPDLYLPDQKALTWMLNRSTVAPEFAQRVATVAVAPTPLVCDPRFRQADPDEPWPLAHPVVVALDLAVDRSRGREVVEAWKLDERIGAERVW